MADENGVGKGLLLGFLTGSIVGAVTALLYAPKTGRELRGDIRERSDEFFQDTEEYIAQAKVKANQLINDGKKKSEELVTDAKVKVDALLDEAEKILDNAKEKTGSYIDTGKVKMEKKSDKLKSAIKAGLDSYSTEKNDKTDKA